jgi:hypothetical protein
LSLLCKDAVDFLGQVLVTGFFVVEVFRAFRRVVDYLRDLRMSALAMA